MNQTRRNIQSTPIQMIRKQVLKGLFKLYQ